jgi:cytosolic phospholipase A2
VKLIRKIYQISVDKPDPYLILSVPGTPNGKKHTKTIDNNVNPVWEQEFEFYLDPDGLYQLGN